MTIQFSQTHGLKIHLWIYINVRLNHIGRRRLSNMPSIPQTYTISDFVQWDHQKQLELSPSFQRGAVWTPQAQTFLIDTILKQLPIPQIYLRTRVNPATKATVREVVDGQQRLRAILMFARNDLRLGARSGEFAGMRYNDLPPETQEQFLWDLYTYVTH